MAEIAGFLKKSWPAFVIVAALLAFAINFFEAPDKYADFERRILGKAPPVLVEALPEQQGELRVTQPGEGLGEMLPEILWPSVYSIHNTSDQDLVIRELHNLLPKRQLHDGTLHLQPVVEKGREVEIFDSWEDLSRGRAGDGLRERLPITIVAGTKTYLRVPIFGSGSV